MYLYIYIFVLIYSPKKLGYMIHESIRCKISKTKGGGTVSQVRMV